MTWNISVRLVGVAFGIIAAFYWFVSAIIDVPDDIDALVPALQHIAKLNSYGAGAAVIAALCGALVFGMDEKGPIRRLVIWGVILLIAIPLLFLTARDLIMLLG